MPGGISLNTWNLQSAKSLSAIDNKDAEALRLSVIKMYRGECRLNVWLGDMFQVASTCMLEGDPRSQNGCTA